MSRSPAAPAVRHHGLDGLRGLAVAAVVAFHLWPGVFPGGWLGVGLFFTLSGYLIAGLLDAEVTGTGRLRLGRFMERRARRLLPAALVTVAAALALTALFDDQPLRAVGVDALAAVLNVFNWHAALDEAGYAAIFESAPAPLAHFWSLAVEEQFYLVFPAAVALTRRPGPVVCAMAVIGLGGVALWWGSSDAYVATPVRALEIAVGAGLALAQARYRAARRLFETPPGQARPARILWPLLVAAAVVVAAVAVARLGPDDGLVFRGGPQLMALCWAVLVVAAVRDGRPARLLSWAPLRWLGLRSYAVYLFHWPLIELTEWHPALVIAATLGLAEVSFQVLEMPVRRGFGPRAVVVLAASAAALVAVSAAAAAASVPVRGIAERAQGADELPAWLTDMQETARLEPPVAPWPTDADTTPGVDTESAGAGDAPAGERGSPSEPVRPSQSSDAAGTPALLFESGPSSIPADATSSTDGSPQSAPTVTPESGHETQPVDVTPPPPTSQPVPGPRAPIVTVLGDSAALHLADGLRAWGDATRLMAVVDHSRFGCSPVGTPDGDWLGLRGELGGDAHAIGFVEGIACRDDHIKEGSDAVLVVDHGAVLFDHQHADGTWASVLDSRLAHDIADSYRHLVRRARSTGTRVVFTTAPRLLATPGEDASNQPQTSPDRADAYNALLRDLIEEFNLADDVVPVGLIDTAAVLDEYGYEGVYGRSDGMHLAYDRAEAFAVDVLGPAMLALLALG